jgi:hypothetical protein
MLDVVYRANEKACAPKGTMLFAFDTLENAAMFAKARLLGDPNRRLPQTRIFLCVTDSIPKPVTRIVDTLSFGPRQTESQDTYKAYWKNRADDSILKDAPTGNVCVEDLTLVADVTDAALQIARAFYPNGYESEDNS